MYSDSWKELYYIDQCDFSFFKYPIPKASDYFVKFNFFLSFIFDLCEVSCHQCLGRWVIFVIPDS